jgi:cytochrome c556
MRRLAMVAALAALGGTAQATDDGTLYVRDAMRGEVNAATLELWDVGNYAMDDEGGLDAAKMDDGLWTRLETAAGLLEKHSAHMSSATTLKSARPDDMETEEGSYSMADVQIYLDSDPETFRQMAKALGDHAAKISAAARARDAARAGLLVGEIDQVCESCHAQYWYPEG